MTIELVDLKQALAELLVSEEPKTDFCDIPQVEVIHIKFRPDCLWHFWDFEKQQVVPITSTAIDCVVTGFEIIESEDEGAKIQFSILGLKTKKAYKIQSGAETIFTKGLVHTLSKLPAEALKSGVKIGVTEFKLTQGKVKTSVSSAAVFNPFTGKQVFAPYDKNTDWQKTYDRLNAKLKEAQSTNLSQPLEATEENAKVDTEAIENVPAE